MSSFFRRLKYYGIGFGIGLFFVFFFFQNRGCSWLPANRVKNSFLDRVIVLPDAEAKKLKANQLNKQDVIEVLNDGEVVFDKSKKEGDTKVYLLEKNFPGKGKVSFFFTLPKESYFTEVHFTAKAAQQVSHKMAYKVKNTEVGVGEILHFPKDMYFYDEILKGEFLRLTDNDNQYYYKVIKITSDKTESKTYIISNSVEDGITMLKDVLIEKLRREIGRTGRKKITYTKIWWNNKQ